MGTILLLLFIIFIVWPLCKFAYHVWLTKRQWQQTTDRMRDIFNRANGQGQQPGGQAPKKKKKKIDPSVGEDVVFEEIACDVKSQTYTAADGTRTTYTESQVEDAIWEDLPHK